MTTGGNAFAANIDPDISDDGARISLRTDRDLTGDNTDGNDEVVLRDTAGGAFTTVTDTTGGAPANNEAAVDGDGSRVAFVSTRDLTGANVDENLELFVADCGAPTSQVCDGQAVTVDLGNGGSPTGGADVILGTAGADSVNALGGNDRFCGLGGNDLFVGGGGNDRAFGGSGRDTLRGDGGRYGVSIAYSEEPEGALETGGGILQALDLLGPETPVVAALDMVPRAVK